MATTTQRKSDDTNRKQKSTGGSSKDTSNLSTFDKLILYLTKTYPDYTVSDFTDALYTYRQEQQTLGGLSLSQIEEGVLSIIRNKYPSRQIDTDTTRNESRIEDITEESVAATLWSTFKRYREREQSSRKTEKKKASTFDEDQCLICLEDLHSSKTETFPCKHTFHRKCLEEWFKIERTCPMCRKLLLFNDEFPAL